MSKPWDRRQNVEVSCVHVECGLAPSVGGVSVRNVGIILCSECATIHHSRGRCQGCNAVCDVGPYTNIPGMPSRLYRLCFYCDYESRGNRCLECCLPSPDHFNVCPLSENHCGAFHPVTGYPCFESKDKHPAKHSARNHLDDNGAAEEWE